MKSLPACLTRFYFSRQYPHEPFDQVNLVERSVAMDKFEKHNFLTALMDSNFPSSRVQLDPYIHLELVRYMNNYFNDPECLDLFLLLNVKSLQYIRQHKMLDRHTVVPRPIVANIFNMFDQLLEVYDINYHVPRFRNMPSKDRPSQFIRNRKWTIVEKFTNSIVEYGDLITLFDELLYDLKTPAFIVFLQLCDYDADEFIADIEHATKLEHNRFTPKDILDIQYPDTIICESTQLSHVFGKCVINGAIHKHLELLLEKYYTQRNSTTSLQRIFT